MHNASKSFSFRKICFSNLTSFCSFFLFSFLESRSKHGQSPMYASTIFFYHLPLLFFFLFYLFFFFLIFFDFKSLSTTKRTVCPISNNVRISQKNKFDRYDQGSISRMIISHTIGLHCNKT